MVRSAVCTGVMWKLEDSNEHTERLVVELVLCPVVITLEMREMSR